MTITGPRGNFVPVFTDCDTAEQFVDDRPVTDYSPSEVSTRELLRDVLTSAGLAGVGYVVMDPAAVGTREAVTFPLDHFLSCLG